MGKANNQVINMKETVIEKWVQPKEVFSRGKIIVKDTKGTPENEGQFSDVLWQERPRSKKQQRSRERRKK